MVFAGGKKKRNEVSARKRSNYDWTVHVLQEARAENKRLTEVPKISPDPDQSIAPKKVSELQKKDRDESEGGERKPAPKEESTKGGKA